MHTLHSHVLYPFGISPVPSADSNFRVLVIVSPAVSVVDVVGERGACMMQALVHIGTSAMVWEAVEVVWEPPADVIGGACDPVLVSVGG